MRHNSKAKLFLRLLVVRRWRQVIVSCLISATLSFWLFKTHRNPDNQILLDLLKSLLEINGVLLGFVIAFFLFVSQSNQTNRQTWFLEFRRNVDDLIDIYMKLSAEKDSMALHLAPAIEVLDNATIGEIPFHADDRKELVAAAEKIASIRKGKSQLMSRNILSNLLKIENSLNRIGLITINVVITGIFLETIKKVTLQIILGFSILIFWKFIYTGVSSYLIIGLFTLTGLLTCGSFGELVIHLSDFYRDESEESGIETERQISDVGG